MTQAEIRERLVAIIDEAMYCSDSAEACAAKVIAKFNVSEKWNYDLEAAPKMVELQVTWANGFEELVGIASRSNHRPPRWHGMFTGTHRVIAWRPLPAPAQPNDGADS